MSRENIAVKELQLKMKLGKANNILTRNLLFILANKNKCGMDVCHRCGQKIKTVDDLSKDHIVDWLHSEDPVKLFFDANNIAFSHKKCNIRRRKREKNQGVRFRTDGNRLKPWRASFSLDNKTVNLGYFATKEEASDFRYNYICKNVVKNNEE